jgi:hypothetical protein
MNKIKPGDLVMVVGECCQMHSELGELFVVRSVAYKYTCHYDGCGYQFSGLCAEAVDGEWPHGVPLQWLKKIPPLENLEGQRDSSGLDERKKRPTPEEFEAELKRWQARMT